MIYFKLFFKYTIIFYFYKVKNIIFNKIFIYVYKKSNKIQSII